jgi:hypothetical protein
MSFRLKAGPNGPSILTSHLDAIALCNNDNLLSAFIGLAFKLPDFGVLKQLKLIHSSCKQNGPKHSLRNGKISLASESALKTRLFAIGNF